MRLYSIYIHLPFCRGRCPYCDFVSHDVRRIPFDEYAAAVSKELELRASALEDSTLSTIYLGGGTPSLWPAARLASLLPRTEALDGVEVSVEVNPGDNDPTWYEALVDRGVSRFSIGVQALDGDRLVELGRRHDARQARDALRAARLSGAESVSADIIYGTPGQTPGRLVAELEALCEQEVDHVSAYELTLSPGSAMRRALEEAGRELPGEGTMLELWQAAGETLAKRGMERYEVSNHARPGHRCEHNLHVWRGGEYLGLGAGAHGCVAEGGRHRRWANDGDLAGYLEGAAEVGAGDPWRGIGSRVLEETLGEVERARERVMLGLRTAEGVDLAELYRMLPGELANRWRAIVETLVGMNLLRLESDVAIPTEAGMLQADGLAERFF
ncbi:MAG: radical SAM family heme chaperone HemW [Polyangia bacterium]